MLKIWIAFSEMARIFSDLDFDLRFTVSCPCVIVGKFLKAVIKGVKFRNQKEKRPTKSRRYWIRPVRGGWMSLSEIGRVGQRETSTTPIASQSRLFGEIGSVSHRSVASQNLPFRKGIEHFSLHIIQHIHYSVNTVLQSNEKKNENGRSAQMRARHC
jgi:hypothetical protein